MDLLSLAILILLLYAAKKGVSAGAGALQNAWRNTHKAHSDRLGRDHPDWSNTTRSRVAHGRTLANAIGFLPETARAARRGWSDARHEYGQGREAHQQWLEGHRQRTRATKAAKRAGTVPASTGGGSTAPGAPGSTAPGAPGSTAPGAPGSTAPGAPGSPGSTAPGSVPPAGWAPAPSVSPAGPTGPTAPTRPPTGPAAPTPTAPAVAPDPGAPMVVPWSPDAPAIGPIVNGGDVGKANAFAAARQAAADAGETALSSPDALERYTTKVPAATSGGNRPSASPNGTATPPVNSSPAPANNGAANGASAPSANGGNSANGNNGGSPMAPLTGETTKYEQTDQAFAEAAEHAAPVVNWADQLVAGLQSRNVDSDTIGDATRISELAKQLSDACEAAQKNHRDNHGGMKEAADTAPVAPADMGYYTDRRN